MSKNKHKQAPQRVVINDPGVVLRDPKKSLGEQIAGSTIYSKNFKWSGANADFPHSPALRTVEYCYPFAVGGTLLIDVCGQNDSPNTFKEKAKVLKKRGYRYLIQTDKMSIMDAMVQLGEVRTDVMDNFDSGSTNASI